MNVFSNIKIGVKITVLVVGLGILILVMSGYGIYQAKSIDTTYRNIYAEDINATTMSSALGMDFNESRAVLLRAVIQSDSSARQQALSRMKELDTETDKDITELESTAKSAEGRASVQQLKAQMADYRTTRTQLMQLSQDGMVDKEALEQAQQKSGAISTHLDEIYTTAHDAGNKRMKEVGASIDSAILWMLVISGVLFICALAAGLTLARQLKRRLGLLGDAADEISEGNLSEELHVTGRDELGNVGESFEKMRQQVHEAIAEIYMAAEQVAAGAKNVSDASVALSQGAAEQASSVEELSASITEISSQTTSNAEYADKANKLTSAAKEHAEIGNNDMQEMLQAMEGINASSANISKIIKVIDEIAFQTNILALNAAVEAARAGQHGKGFAVVAEEVRNLAARSAKAAKETTDMIEGSIAKVNDGREIAHKTAEALHTIVTHVSDVAELVSSIAKASKEQSLALEQVNQGVVQVSQVVQSNSATSEEAASASEELSTQADLLKTTAGRFKLEKGTVNQAMPLQRSSQDHNVKPKKPKRIALTEEEGFGKY